MTSREIAAMFKAGSVWRCTNTAIPEAFPDMRSCLTKVTRGGSKELTMNGGSWMTLPPAHAVIEARDGFLHYYCNFENPRPDRTIKMERVSG